MIVFDAGNFNAILRDHGFNVKLWLIILHSLFNFVDET